MKKIAFFVEGKTEFIFIRHFIHYLFEKNSILIDNEARKENLLIIQGKAVTKSYYVLIRNCQGETQVVPKLLDEHKGLNNSGYDKVILMRDVDPLTKNDIENLTNGINKSIRNVSIDTDIVLSTMEIEAWFLAEHKHMTKINSKLTPSFIKEKRGYDPQNHNFEDLQKPSIELKEIFMLVGTGYSKKKESINRIVKNIDFNYMTSHLMSKYKSFGTLVDSCNNYF